MKQENNNKDITILIDYITNTLLPKYPHPDSNVIYYIVGMLESEETMAYNILSKVLMNSQINEIKEYCYEILESVKETQDIIPLINIESDIKKILTNLDNTTTVGLLKYLFENDGFTVNLFKRYGVSSRQISDHTTKQENVEIPKKHTKKKTTKSSTISKPTTIDDDNEVEKYLVNLVKQSSENKIIETVGNEHIVEEIFKTFLKKENNNVILVGEHGVGRSALVKNIANLLLTNKVPKQFHDKLLMEMNFSTLVVGTALRGTLENRIKNIINDAKAANKYIFFIDDIEYIMDSRNYSENSIETILQSLLNENKINIIITTTPKGYSMLSSDYPSLVGKLNKIELREPTNEECINILNNAKEKYEIFHNVTFNEQSIVTCVDLCKRFLTENKLPSIAIDVLDETGAYIRINEQPTPKIIELQEQLCQIKNEKEHIINVNSHKNADKIDELTKKEIKLKSLINIEEKNAEINRTPILITDKEIRETISKKSGIPITKINENEKTKLKTLHEKLKSMIIGQDEAIDEVCGVIKRQRLGLSNPNKPAVLMFTGSTGTGKTYLAKKISELVFGDEKYMVRLDMSEYSDKMAASKLIGSNAGYIGYDDGGILTEAIKKNKYCVLLLDECEKADETVFNMLLQVFDEGHLTDNKGIKVNFKNVIVIMTSNVGAQEASERNGGIGFNISDNVNNFEKSIYERAIKRQFKPEFINRIDKIVFFNKLTEDNLRNIISLEIDKLNNRLMKINYGIDKNSYNNFIEEVMKGIKQQKNYGARPIIRELQKVIEDKVADLIINNEYENNHLFTYEELITK